MPEALEVFDWGGRKTLWIDSERIDECLSYYREHGLDGIGVNPLHGYKASDLSFLRDHPYVTGLVVVPSTRTIDLAGIEKLKELRYLSISETRQPLSLEEFPKLEEFRGDWHAGLEIGPRCPALRVLQLWHYRPKSLDLGELPELPRLGELGLTQSPLLSLSGLARFSGLRRLELAHLAKLESIHPAEELPELGELDCHTCRKLKDHERIAKSKTLKSLRYNNCGSLPSLRFLRQMPELEEFRFVNTEVRDGDMTPLFGLMHVGFVGKKRYSHTPEQVDAVLRKKGGSAIPRLEEGGA